MKQRELAVDVNETMEAINKDTIIDLKRVFYNKNVTEVMALKRAEWRKRIHVTKDMESKYVLSIKLTPKIAQKAF